MLKKIIIIQNKLGLHTRASMKLVNIAGRFESDIIIKQADIKVNAKSIMNIMALAAHQGTEIELIISGADEELAMEAVTELIENCFEEEE